MEKAKQQLEKLIEIGKEFTYDNFSLKSVNGYPNALVPEWISWETRCRGIIKNLFGKDSAQDNAIETAMNTDVISWGEDKFILRRNYITGVLQTAVDILSEDLFDENTGEVIALANENLTEGKIQDLLVLGINTVKVLYIDMVNYGDQIRNTLLLDKTATKEEGCLSDTASF